MSYLVKILEMSINSVSALSSASPLSSRYNNNNERIFENTRSHVLQRHSKRPVIPVQNVTIQLTRYPKAEDINSIDDYKKLSFGQQYLYFIPQSMNERDRPAVVNFPKRLFYKSPGLLPKKTSIIPKCILNLTKSINNDRRYNNSGDESSDDGSSISFMNDDDPIYNGAALNIRSECKRNAASFLNGLKYFHTYDGSFRVKSDNYNHKYCYCPFSKAMHPWIQFNNLNNIMGKEIYQAF